MGVVPADVRAVDGQHNALGIVGVHILDRKGAGGCADAGGGMVEIVGGGISIALLGFHQIQRGAALGCDNGRIVLTVKGNADDLPPKNWSA